MDYSPTTIETLVEMGSYYAFYGVILGDDNSSVEAKVCIATEVPRDSSQRKLIKILRGEFPQTFGCPSTLFNGDYRARDYPPERKRDYAISHLGRIVNDARGTMKSPPGTNEIDLSTLEIKDLERIIYEKDNQEPLTLNFFRIRFEYKRIKKP